MARLLWLPQVLRDAGLKVVTHSGWEARGKDTLFTHMNVPRGIVAHHTATGLNWTNASVEYLLAVKGNATTPAPLAHLGLRRDGTYVVLASGVANHAGLGSWKGISGNRNVIGIEAYNDGRGEPWPYDQLLAYDRGVTAILHHLNLDAWALCGHKEWRPLDKIDPYGIDMVKMRNRVHYLLQMENAMATLSDAEVLFLRDMIARLLAIQSNSSFAEVLVNDYRLRKST